MTIKPEEARQTIERILSDVTTSIQCGIDKWLVTMGMAKEYEEGLVYHMPEKLWYNPNSCVPNFTFSRAVQKRLADNLAATYREAGWQVSVEEGNIDGNEGVHLHFKRRQ